MRPVLFCLTLAACAAPSLHAHAQLDPVSGAEFLTITAAGNPAWPPGPTGYPVANATGGRGSVGYDYRIAKTEVTTAQWVEFMNAVFDRPESDRIPFRGSPPSFWGAAGITPNTPGARRWRVVPGRENLPVSPISWRAGAIYCNWLHNGKALDRSAFLTGAYDVSSFGVDAAGNFTDQAARSPGARYFIPTLDEWMKAAHYDPNKNGPGAGGWWVYPNSSDTPPISGPPGVGQTSAGTWNSSIPLMSYPTTKSPWGLLDVSGGNSEWTESILAFPGGDRYRWFDGTSVISSALFERDAVWDAGADYPNFELSTYGLRIGAPIPSPGTAALALIFSLTLTRRRRR